MTYLEPRDKICVICEESFSTKHSTKKCCSEKCSLIYNHKNQLIKYKENRKITHPIVDVPCKFCGKIISSKYTCKKFCSRSCWDKFRYYNNVEKSLRTTLLWKKNNVEGNRVISNRWRLTHPKEFIDMEIKSMLPRVEAIKNKSGDNFEKEIRLNDKQGRMFRRLTEYLFDSELPKVCELCGSTERLHIHHKIYDFPIRIEHLQRLCQACHNTFHKKKYSANSVLELNTFTGESNA